MTCVTMYYYNGTGCPIFVSKPHYEHSKKCLNELMTLDLPATKLCGKTRQDLGDAYLEDIKQMEEMICKASNNGKITQKTLTKAAKKWIKNYRTNSKFSIADIKKALGVKEIKDYQYAQMWAGNWNNKICKLLILKRIPNNNEFGVQEIRADSSVISKMTMRM